MAATRGGGFTRRLTAVLGRLGGLRPRLLLLVSLAVLPMLGLILATYLEDRRMAVARVQADTQALIRLAVSRQQGLIEGAQQLLAALAQLPAVRARDAQACRTLFAELLSQYSFYANLGAADLAGEAFCSGLHLERPVNIADRAYFQEALRQRGFAVGEYQIGRITGRATLNFGFPIPDAEGRPAGVVFAALDLGWLAQIAGEVELPPQASLVVLDRNGTILFHYPDGQRWRGTEAVETPLFEVIRAWRSGEVIEAANLAGVPSLFAFAVLRSPRDGEEADAYLAVGIPTAVAFAEVERIFTRRLVFFSAVTLLALATAWWFGERMVLRPTRALLAATERLQRGELEARTGLALGHGELGRLALAFDRMAGQLQAHEAQLRRSLAEITELKNLLDNVFASLVSGVITTDLHGRIMLCNSAALRILGYRDADELIGRNIDELPAPIDTALAPLLQIARTDKPVLGLELRPTLASRGTVILRFNLSSLKGPQGTQGVAIVLDDLTEQRRLEAQRQVFERMVSPAILGQLDPEHLHLGGRRSELSILFADIHGFTGLGERLDPDALMTLLNRYLAAMADAVLAEQGTIDKFLGDAVMAWFNAPFPQPDHVLRALRAALGIRDAFRALHEELPPAFRLSFGIGVHVGEAVLGLIGSERRIEYTAIGGDVNTAKRIQEHAGLDQILISAAVHARVAECVEVRPATLISVKGKRQPLEVYELLGLI